MRLVSQIASIANSELSGALFALEATIVSVAGGTATVQPTAKRIFPDNDEAISYPPVSGVRLLSLCWNGGKSGVSGEVKAGDECLLIAISHSDGEQPDHKMLSACCAFVGFNDKAEHTMPDSVGIRIFHSAANITLDDDNITVDNGAGAKLVFDSSGITLTAPGGYTVNADTTINGKTTINGLTTVNGETELNGDVDIAGNLNQEGGEGGMASFGGDVNIEGVSISTDHLSGGGTVSGLSHEHKVGDEISEPPIPG